MSKLVVTELQEAIEAYKSKTDEYLKRYEEAEINRAKAARAEAFGMCIPFCVCKVTVSHERAHSSSCPR